MLHDPLNRTVLTGGISAFENDHNFLPSFDHMPLQFDQLDLRCLKFSLHVRLRALTVLLRHDSVAVPPK
jgi:hypothetical protein